VDIDIVWVVPSVGLSCEECHARILALLSLQSCNFFRSAYLQFILCWIVDSFCRFQRGSRWRCLCPQTGSWCIAVALAASLHLYNPCGIYRWYSQ
jgi:hypothetical protein